MAMLVSRALSSQITTRFTQPVKTIADIEALEQRPYDSLVPSRNLLDLFEATRDGKIILTGGVKALHAVEQGTLVGWGGGHGGKGRVGWGGGQRPV